MHSRLLISVFVSALACWPAIAQPTIHDFPILDDFDDGSFLPEWQSDELALPPSGSFTVDGGRVSITTSQLNFGDELFIGYVDSFLYPDLFVNGTVIAEVRADPGTDAGIGLRVQYDPFFEEVESYLGFVLSDEGRAYIELLDYTMGVEEELGSFPVAYTPGETWILEAQAHGSQLTLRAWEISQPRPTEPLVEVFDSRLTSGGSAIGFAGDEAVGALVSGTIDNVRLLPELQITEPSVSIGVVQGDAFDIHWIDGDQAFEEIRFYLDEDLVSNPWNEPGVAIPLPASIATSPAVNQTSFNVADVAPGTYSLWAEQLGGDLAQRSVAGGLVTVVETAVEDQPDVEIEPIEIEDALQYLTFVRAGSSPNRLFLVTHGWNGPLPASQDLLDLHPWVVDIATDTADHIAGPPSSDDQLWDVAYLDWTADAGDGVLNSSPSAAFTNARLIGRSLANEFINARLPYTHIEIVAHSAGSWIGDTFARELASQGSDAEVTLHLLDAFLPPIFHEDSTPVVAGRFAAHVFNYYDDTPSIQIPVRLPPYIVRVPLPFTQSPIELDHAFNADISCRNVTYSNYPTASIYPWNPGGNAHDHGLPWVWFRDSVTNAGASWLDDNAFLSPGGSRLPLGFKASRAYAGGINWPLVEGGHYDDSGELFNWDGDFDLGCEARIDDCDSGRVLVMHRDTIALDELTMADGGSGEVSFQTGDPFFELESGPDSHWVGFEIPIDRMISAVGFDAGFSSPGTDGFLTAHWQGQQQTSLDQRADDEQGVRQFFSLSIPQLGGTRVLSFRLDAGVDGAAHAFFGTVRTGTWINSDINGDCLLNTDDLCTYVRLPEQEQDLDGDGIANQIDLELLADALGVSEEDSDGNGQLDACESCESVNPLILASFDSSDYAYGVAYSGSQVYIADGEAGLQILDASDPANPTILGSVDTPDRARGVALLGSVAYVADFGSGLQVIDVGDPANPTILGSLVTPDRAMGVAVSGSVAYVADSGSGLQVIDIGDAANPTILGSVDTPTSMSSVAVSGSLVYATDLTAGLQVIDVSDPTTPTILGSVDTPSLALDVAVSGAVAYVANHGSGLVVIDVFDPSSPEIIATVETPDRASSIAVSGTTVYVADYANGLQVLDVSDPASPVFLGSVDTPDAAQGIRVSGSVAYVVDGSSGLQIVDVSCGGACNAADLAEPYGVLDYSDVFAFLVAFGNSEPAADLAEPLGVFDYSDVFEFLVAFGAGCP